eukprot:6862216-Karenia_brevis.AAC.1
MEVCGNFFTDRKRCLHFVLCNAVHNHQEKWYKMQDIQLSMSDEEFIYRAKAITNVQNAKQHRYHVIAAPRDSKLWKKEAKIDSSL